jgi:hypothetical protein
MAYDSSLNGILVGGGAGNKTGYWSDLWLFKGGTWSQISTGARGHRFHGEWLPMATYPPKHEAIYVGDRRYYNPVTWSINATGMHRLHPAVNPTSSLGASMAYDPGLKALVMFGGTSNQGTWSFHAGIWTNITAGQQPSQQWNPSLTYDQSDGYLITYGQGETWVLR